MAKEDQTLNRKEPPAEPGYELPFSGAGCGFKRQEKNEKKTKKRKSTGPGVLQFLKKK